MKRFAPGTRRRLLGLLLFGLAVACAVNPVTGKRELALISEEREITMGSANYAPAQQSQGGAYETRPEISRYVQEVGGRMAATSDRPNLPYEFVVLNNSVPNAWAMPGGKIAINRGLLLGLDNEAELAAVLAHEIVHAAARHGAKAMERALLLQAGTIGLGAALSDQRNSELLLGAAAVGATLISQKYSREQELEADFYSMHYLSKAGYDPAAAVTLQEKFVKLAGDREPSWLEGLFATHPPSQERVEANRKTAAALSSGGKLGAADYRQRIGALIKNQPAYASHDQGRKALDEGKADAALKLAERAIAAEPSEALFHSLRGDALTSQNRAKPALAAYDRAVALAPGYFYHHLQRGLLLKKINQPHEAKIELEKSAELMPNSAAHYSLGELAMTEGNADRAAGHFRLVAAADSEIGRAAARQLAILELPKEPEKYIRITFSLDQAGRLHLKLHNLAPVAVRDLRLAIGLSNAGGQVVGRDTRLVSEVLAAGGQLETPTSLVIAPHEVGQLQPTAVILTLTVMGD